MPITSMPRFIGTDDDVDASTDVASQSCPVDGLVLGDDRSVLCLILGDHGLGLLLDSLVEAGGDGTQ